MKQLRVLLVEDDPDHRFLTSRALQAAEDVTVEVDAVADGAEALDFLYRRAGYETAQAPNLVILDLRMPRVGGLEVLAQVKTDPTLKKIPVVVLTGSDRPEDVDDTYRLGGNSFVTKPVGLRALEEVAAYWTVRSALPDPAL
jgi:two-component system, chemotaxis family, response regulator Rcp1